MCCLKPGIINQPVQNYWPEYLFFFDQGTDATEMGYMPLSGQFGYIIGYHAASEAAYNRTIAHEIAHVREAKQVQARGAAAAFSRTIPTSVGSMFNLRHTFSNENSHYQLKGSTVNLLDYAAPTATGLYKYQWDLMHDPESIWFAWMEEEEEGEIIDYSKLSESIRKELLEIINKLKTSPSPIFAFVYSELEKKYRNIMGFDFDNVFQVNIMDKNDERYYKEGQKYVSAGYFKKADNIADVEYFPKFQLTNVKFGGSTENPDMIVFQPEIQLAEGQVFAGYKNISTVFEEFFHAGQYLWYTSPITLYEKEVEVEVAKAFEYYAKGWSKEFYDQTGLTFLNQPVISEYFNKLLSKKKILPEEEQRFRNILVSIAKSEIYPAYKSRVSTKEIIEYKGSTRYFDFLIKK